MAVTTPERYVVVSCHVEQPLDDQVWQAFVSLQARRPGGLVIAALMRPPDRAFGEHEDTWLERAGVAAAQGPLGHHTHWTSPTHARPTGAVDPAERVQSECLWLRERGVAPTLFCGGGWYTDARVAAACATAGYADCTPRATRPAYLDPGARWAQLGAPAHLRVGEGLRLHALPTTHSAGEALRAGLGRKLPAALHVYFHDTDLVDARRQRIVVAALRILGRRRPAMDLDQLIAVTMEAPEMAWDTVIRGDAGESAG
jgi:hypothetical protein